jgi:protein O-mannosyl-transferase
MARFGHAAGDRASPDPFSGGRSVVGRVKSLLKTTPGWTTTEAVTDVVLGWSESRRDALHAALIGVLVALLFAPALSNGFVNWDDDRVLLDNPAIVSPHGLRRIWSSVELPEGFPNYPLVATSYWVEYRLWGASPLPYHAANILLHGLNAALVFLLLRGLGARPWVAGFAAALFGVHPMQVESVAWVAERKNLVSAAFYLAAFIAYLRHRATDRWGWYGATLALFAAALLSKTATVVLPLSLLLADRFQLGRWSRGSLARMLPLFGLGLAAGLQTLFAESHPAVSVVWWLRPLLAASAVWFYLSKLLLPLGLYPVYPRWDIDPGAVRWWIPVAALAASALLLWYWRPDWRARWGAGHFVVALLPVIGLVPFGFNEMSFVADHEAYLASIGVCLAVAIGVDAWAARVGRPTVNALAAAALLVLGSSTVRQIPVWRDSVSLWRTALVGNPAAWVAHNNLAFALLQQRHFDEAVAHLHTAVQLRPDYAEPYTNLALAAYLREDFAAAERYSRRAVEMRPDVADYAKNLALALEAEGNLRGAEE